MEETIRTTVKLVPGEYIDIITTLPDKTKSTKKCEFREVTRKEASNMRLKNIPYCVMRIGDKIYVAVLPKEYSQRTLGIEHDHLCDKCKYCRAIPTEKGGCDKVRDRLLESLTGITLQKIREEIKVNGEKAALPIKESYIGYVRESKRLEKYPYISFGLETVHTGNDVFIVSDCQRFLHDVRKNFKPLITADDINDSPPTSTVYVNGIYKLF